MRDPFPARAYVVAFLLRKHVREYDLAPRCIHRLCGCRQYGAAFYRRACVVARIYGPRDWDDS